MIQSSSWPGDIGLEHGPIASSRPQKYSAPGDGDKRGLLEEKKKTRSSSWPRHIGLEAGPITSSRPQM